MMRILFLIALALYAAVVLGVLEVSTEIIVVLPVAVVVTGIPALIATLEALERWERRKQARQQEVADAAN